MLVQSICRCVRTQHEIKMTAMGSKQTLAAVGVNDRNAGHNCPSNQRVGCALPGPEATFIVNVE